MGKASDGNFWGQLIQELRREKGLSQRRLSEAAAVNRSTLRRIEEGKARVGIDVIERLLEFMGYELEAIHCDAVKAKQELMAVEAADTEGKSRKAVMSLLQFPTLTYLS